LLRKAYGRALIARDELQDEIHSCSLETIVFGVNAFADEFGDEAAAGFVVAADLPIYWERVFTREELDADPESSWLPEGYWNFDKNDCPGKGFSARMTGLAEV
jgi:hypothetical protein